MLAREEAWYSCTLIEEKNSKLRLMLKVVPGGVGFRSRERAEQGMVQLRADGRELGEADKKRALGLANKLLEEQHHRHSINQRCGATHSYSKRRWTNARPVGAQAFLCFPPRFSILPSPPSPTPLACWVPRGKYDGVGGRDLRGPHSKERRHSLAHVHVPAACARDTREALIAGDDHGAVGGASVAKLRDVAHVVGGAGGERGACAVLQAVQVCEDVWGGWGGCEGRAKASGLLQSEGRLQRAEEWAGCPGQKEWAGGSRLWVIRVLGFQGLTCEV